MELDIEINGVRGKGVTIVEQAPAYTIQVRSRVQAELIVLNSCHREQTFEVKNDTFTAVYQPTFVEREGYCPLKISVYSNKLWYQAAFIALKSTDTLMARVACNGQELSTEGTSVCQAKVGLVQRIEFPMEAVPATQTRCQPPKQLSKNAFEIKAEGGLCVYTFKGAAGIYHQLSMLGYDEYLR